MDSRIILQATNPRVIPEPFTPEPVETYSKDDIDEFVEAFRSIAKEAYENPCLVKSAPHNAALASQIDETGLTDWEKFATTWRAYKKISSKAQGGQDLASPGRNTD